MPKKLSPEEQVEADALELVNQELALRTTEAELVAENPKFGEFLQSMKAFEKNSKILWSTVEDQMIKYQVKQIGGEWGTISLVNRTTYKAEDIDKVPAKFLKKVLDTTKINAHTKLTSKLPAGVTAEKKQNIMRRIK